MRDQIETAIDALPDAAGTPGRWVARGLIRVVSLSGGASAGGAEIPGATARLVVEPTLPEAERPGLEAALRAMPGTLPGLAAVEIAHATAVPDLGGATRPAPRELAGVGHVIAVGAGKGGVGKSSVAVNLAVGLGQRGLRVGLLDADIFGPSAHRMLGATGRNVAREDALIPLSAHGVALVSAGSLFPPDSALIWRGPILVNTLRQMLFDVAWPALDVLVVDLPPGTGDVALTLAQQVDLTGAIVVTTPQDISLIDTRRALDLFDRLEVPVLGVVENMSTHVCSACGHEEAIFKTGGGAALAEATGIEFLGALPLDGAVCEGGDAGAPFVLEDGPAGRAMGRVVDRISALLGAAPGGAA